MIGPMLLDEDRPWPDVPRTAIQAGGTRPFACSIHIASRSTGSYGAYARGYAEAAKATFGEAARGEVDAALLLFPLGMLWRQCFELYLKDIIWRGSEMRSQGGGSLKVGHLLHDLWVAAVPFMANFGDIDAPEVANVGSIIGEMVALDRTGQEFRYPMTTAKKPSLSTLPPVVNLEAFHDAMLAVYNFLETVAGLMLDAHSDLLSLQGRE